MKKVILLIALVSTMFGADAQNSITPIEFNQISSTPQYAMTVYVDCDANERPTTKSYDSASRTWTIKTVPSSTPPKTHTLTYSGSIVPIVGLGYTCQADTSKGGGRPTSFVLFDED